MANLICIQLETNHFNRDGSAWYAYFDGEPTEEDHQKVFDDKSKVVNGGCLGCSGEIEGPPQEDSTPLSEYAGLRRYYVAMAC